MIIGVPKEIRPPADRPPADPLAVCIDAIYATDKLPATAFIDESTCIGCTLCIQACPVDAIVGAAKQMHTVVAAWCTGCELCVPPCPADCISMSPLLVRPETPQIAAERARQRYRRHLLRREGEKRQKAGRQPVKTTAGQTPRLENSAHLPSAGDAPIPPATAASTIRQALVAAAIARARQINARP